MAEIDFERRLERLFADAPAFSDESAFAARVEQRLNRGWNVRRWFIGAAGVASGIGHAFTQSSTTLSDWTVVWIASGLAVLAMGFVLTRVIEEI